MEDIQHPLYIMMYTSICTDQGKNDMGEIVRHANANNPKNDVTGVLVYNAGKILQFLEGPQNRVKELYSKIEKDPRHTRAEVLYAEPTLERCFSEWSMGFIGSADAG